MSPAVLVLVGNEGESRSPLVEVFEAQNLSVETVDSIPRAIERREREGYGPAWSDYLALEQRDVREDHLSGLSLTVLSALVQRFAILTQSRFAGELLREVADKCITVPGCNVLGRVLDYFDVLSRAKWDALAEMCSEDVCYSVAGPLEGPAQTVVGRIELWELSQQAFQSYPNARFEVREVCTFPQGAVARYRGHWHTADQGPVTLEGVVAFSFVKQYITRIRVTLEAARLEQLQRGIKLGPHV